MGRRISSSGSALPTAGPPRRCETLEALGSSGSRDRALRHPEPEEENEEGRGKETLFRTMGNCCRSPAAVAREDVKSSYYHDQARRDRDFRGGSSHNGGDAGGQKKLIVLKDGNYNNFKAGIDGKYMLDRELGRGEFGVTYLCMDRETRELLACKSISKRKLRTSVDVEDVRREVAIMRHLPKNPSIVSLREACEDDRAVHLVMELCEGGELFDRIVARGHYTERAAAVVTRTIVEVVQLCHRHGVIHRDLKPENFLFANKKENSPLKAIDFGLSIFFKPGECS